jgi:hypothetical protein
MREDGENRRSRFKDTLVGIDSFSVAPSRHGFDRPAANQLLNCEILYKQKIY